VAPLTPVPRAPVPWRTIVASVATVAAAFAGYLLLRELARIIAWLVVAGFLAIVLAPAVDKVQHGLHARRLVATLLVFVLGVGAFGGMVTAFVTPVVKQVTEFSDKLPQLLEDAQAGRGAVGDIVERLKLQDVVERNRADVQKYLRSAGKPAVKAVRGVFNTALAILTILVLTFLLLLRGPALCASVLALVPARQQGRVRVVAADVARAVSGYMLGNFLISIVAGLTSYIPLRIMNVPYSEVIALFVAFADLIPLIGATLGAVPAVGVAFLHSSTAGIVMLVFYVLYQQFENHVLQPAIMSRTVDVDPLTVLVSVLVGVELLGIVGALLAIPAAGALQVIIRNVWDERHGRLKPEPTVGPDETPVSEAQS
jgi:predicted PurR-regulated permease PerM